MTGEPWAIVRDSVLPAPPGGYRCHSSAPVRTLSLEIRTQVNKSSELRGRGSKKTIKGSEMGRKENELRVRAEYYLPTVVRGRVRHEIQEGLRQLTWSQPLGLYPHPPSLC